jgi:putative transcriptional regulator
MEFPTWEDIHEKPVKNAKGIKLRRLRVTTELSQRKFAEKFNIPCRTIENWEEGITEPPDYVLELLTKVVVANNIIKLMEEDTDEIQQAHEEYLQAIVRAVKVRR